MRAPPPCPGRNSSKTKSPSAAPNSSRSALHNALTGPRLPGKELLAAFAAACGAAEETTRALLAARSQIQTGPEPQARARYPCEIAEQAEERRARDAAAHHWIPNENEPDEYGRLLDDEKEAEYRRMAAWTDSLTDNELKELEQARSAGAGRDLRAELAAYIPR
ncbi:hypothetical protein [Streptomyces sp. NPDC002962]|uniref:hypothetical protein n=1 Tax=Streptomyces sp. NPDC002962 TaxID=3364674 RepID=UPI00368BC185